jgi:hypothetical protein
MSAAAELQIPEPEASRIHVLEGPEIIDAAQPTSEPESKRMWPYPWTYPPPGATRVQAGMDASGTIVTPAQGVAAVQGLLYVVDQGFQFALTDVIVIYINTTTANQGCAPGSFLWSLDVNSPVGVPFLQGSPIQGFTNIDVPTLALPWPLRMPEFFGPNDAIRSKFVNVSLAVGAPNYFKTILLGWRWPVDGAPIGS